MHYITLHCIALQYIALHYITLHYITLHYITIYILTQVKLGEWVHTQRRQRASGVLMPVRVAKLDKLAAQGLFSWSLQYVSGSANAVTSSSAFEGSNLESRVHGPGVQVAAEGDL